MLILHLSFGTMSLIIQLSVSLLTVVYAIHFPDTKKAFKFAIYSMLSANVFGQLIVAGEGPAFLPGFVILPLCGMLAAYVTVILTKKKAIKKP